MRRLAEALEKAERTRSRKSKVAVLADALAAISAEDTAERILPVAARLAAGRTLPVGDARATGVGWALLVEAAVAVTGRAPHSIRSRSRARGDLGSALQEVLAPLRQPAGLRLAEAGELFEALATAPQRGLKLRLLTRALARATALEARYLTRALLGEMRTGVAGGLLEEAIGTAFDAPRAQLRAAATLVPDVGELALLAWRGKLGDVDLRVGRPFAFMLASPLEGPAPSVDPLHSILEDKLDGIRAQLHKRGLSVDLFTRGLERRTDAFPEIVRTARGLPGDLVLDGEIVVVDEQGRPRPFQALQPRLTRSSPGRDLVDGSPARFVAFDLLYDGEALLALPWTERRRRLEGLPLQGSAVTCHPARRVPVDRPLAEVLDEDYASARQRGHEGLVLKRDDAPYAAGTRGSAWLKVKRAFATLDVVVIAAEQGHGKRAGVLSDYTFAVWREGELVPVGKAYTGLTDAEIVQLSRRFEELTVEHRGGWRKISPAVVLEVAFDGIQRSQRHSSGYALRFPRIVRVREDKGPGDADHLATVQTLYESLLSAGLREDRLSQPSGRRRPRKPSPQLELFDEPRD